MQTYISNHTANWQSIFLKSSFGINFPLSDWVSFGQILSQTARWDISNAIVNLFRLSNSSYNYLSKSMEEIWLFSMSFLFSSTMLSEEKRTMLIMIRNTSIGKPANISLYMIYLRDSFEMFLLPCLHMCVLDATRNLLHLFCVEKGQVYWNSDQSLRKFWALSVVKQKCCHWCCQRRCDLKKKSDQSSRHFRQFIF